MFDNFGYNNQVETPPQPPPKKGLHFDKGYIRTLPGGLKGVEIICNLIGFICIKVSWSFFSAIFYNILYWAGNIITLFLFFMYLFHFVEKYSHWPWIKLEMYYCGLMSLAYIVCAIFATTIGESVGYAVGFFGLCAIIAYGFDGYLKYKLWRRGLPAQ